MKKQLSKKKFILTALFILPLVFFLLLSTGINNFKKLPVVTLGVSDVSKSDSVKIQLKENIIRKLKYPIIEKNFNVFYPRTIRFEEADAQPFS